MAVKPDPEDKLIAGAEAAASWARARRAKWTSRPLEVPEPPSEDAPVEFESHVQPQPTPQPHALPPVVETAWPQPPPVRPAPIPQPQAAPPPRPAPIVASTPLEIEPLSASVLEATVETRHLQPPPSSPPKPKTRRARGARMPPWLPVVGVGLAVGILAVAVASYGLKSLSDFRSSSETPAAVERRAEPPPAVVRKPSGTVSVTSTPSGARVVVDGKPRGVTPLQLADVSPGRHEVVLTGDAGEVRRTITVAAGKTVTLDEAIFSGWVAVYSPFEITVAEGGRVLRPDDRGQILLPPGAHTLRFVNQSLGYDESRQIDVKPGEGTPIRLTPGPSKLTVTATEPAEVWIDGTRVGETPLSGAAVPLGTHEIVVRRAAGGERRFTVSIGVAPYQLHVDFSQPGG
ncbi:MAG TPA: PEGA domain-containing protein [Vicinamibacterales bacterium]|nr:PEGA domain-containing protein [Vicinamibacterales bacterium]